jgi:lysophospholipase L1-like esterase
VKRVRLVAVAIICMLSLAACSGGGGASSTTATTAPGPARKLLTIGGASTDGAGLPNRLDAAWPYLIYHEALSTSSVLVNGAVNGATAAGALDAQVPLVRQEPADVVAIWLGAADLADGTPVDAFAASLRDVVAAARAGGAEQILVADLPDALGAVDPYNDAIRGVAREARAQLVELSGAPVTFASGPGERALADAASQRLVAGAFESALRRPAG